MRWMLLGGVMALVLGVGRMEAATPEHFKVPTTGDLIALCTVGNEDPLRAEAIHFCHGYLAGAYQFQEAMRLGLVCPPEPRPSRDQAVQEFVAWARAHPQHMGERPVDSLMRFLTGRWPCK